MQAARIARVLLPTQELDQVALHSAWIQEDPLKEMTPDSKNWELVRDFARYCDEHPEERFWQALRNWSGWSFIFGADGDTYEQAMDRLKETFYLDGKKS